MNSTSFLLYSQSYISPSTVVFYYQCLYIHFNCTWFTVMHFPFKLFSPTYIFTLTQILLLFCTYKAMYFRIQYYFSHLSRKYYVHFLHCTYSTTSNLFSTAPMYFCIQYNLRFLCTCTTYIITASIFLADILFSYHKTHKNNNK